MTNTNDPQPQWEKFTYAQKVVEVWQEQKKYAKSLTKNKEDGEDILQDVVEMFLNPIRINDVFIQKETQIILTKEILSFQNNEPPTNDYNDIIKSFNRCLRSLAKKKIRLNKNESVSIYEFRKVCNEAGIQTDNPIVIKEIDNFFETLCNKNDTLQIHILHFIEKKNGFPINKIAQMHNKSIRKVNESIDIVTDILEKLKKKEKQK